MGDLVSVYGDRLVPLIDDRPELGYCALTPCCGATGKGSADTPTGVVCRSCYRDVEWHYGVPFGADGDVLREVFPGG